MVKKADLGSKRLISLAPNNWVRWVTQQPEIEVLEFLDSEFQWLGRENDVLIKVLSPEQGPFLLLNEIQLRYSQKMPLRMRAYAALAEERYNLSVYPVLINILPHSRTQKIPESYQSEFMGLKATQDYRVINLWEIEASLVFQQEITSLLPFVPILKGGGEESMVRQAVKELRTKEQLSELEPLLSFFASFVLEIPIIQKIMRWDMTVLRESPWYQEILKEGLEKGEKQGLQRGLQQGLQQGEKAEAINLISRQLKKRFGTVEVAMQERIRQLSVPQLEALGESLLDFTSLSDLLCWLDQANS
jgi:predicted transposase YdaD